MNTRIRTSFCLASIVLLFLTSTLSLSAQTNEKGSSVETLDKKELSNQTANENFMGVDELKMDPEAYRKKKEAWIKANPKEYEAMNPGTSRRQGEASSELVVLGDKEIKAEDGENPLENYDLKPIPKAAQGTWVLASVEGVVLREGVSQADADQLAEEAKHDFPLGETILKLSGETFDGQFGKGKYLKGDCGFVVEGNQILLTRSRLCKTCNPLIQFKILENQNGKLSLRLEDEDGARIYYQLNFIETN